MILNPQHLYWYRHQRLPAWNTAWTKLWGTNRGLLNWLTGCIQICSDSLFSNIKKICCLGQNLPPPSAQAVVSKNQNTHGVNKRTPDILFSCFLRVCNFSTNTYKLLKCLWSLQSFYLFSDFILLRIIDSSCLLSERWQLSLDQKHTEKQVSTTCNNYNRT